MVSVTEQWAQYAVAGPRSRELLQRLVGSAADLSNDAFPYLACAEFPFAGVPARLFRLSFSGELAYEIAVPARFGDALRSEEHTSELQSLMRISYAVFCLKKKKQNITIHTY